MKRILLAVAILALVLPAPWQAEARADVSFDFFYDNLGDGGNWVEVGDYGYCWQPNAAVSNSNWRPYSDGYWAYTDVGWTWVSYEDFGWATYHYGRWMRLHGRGWVWVPDREWGPAWVSWRIGGDYVGWAPLPPRRAGDYYDNSPITARVDIDLDIGPASYNFIDVRYIGEPVLRERIFAADQNVTYISKTVNVTNITYTNSTVYNRGPDYDTLSRYSARPIQRLTLQRETNIDPAAAARSKSLMKVQGDRLVIAAPQQLQRPTKAVAPKVVKEKIAQAPVERGWEPVGDRKAQTELKEKMKKEDPKSVPPPTVRTSEKAGASPAANSPGATTARTTSATTATPADAMSPAIRPDKNRNKRDEKVSPSTTPAASVPAATSPAPTRDKDKNRQRDNAAPSATDNAASSAPPKPPREKADKHKIEPAPPPPAPMELSAPKVAPPSTPETKRNRPEPDSVKPDAAVEKPKHEPASQDPAKSLRKEPPQERVAPAPPARDQGKKKNEPATSPTP